MLNAARMLLKLEHSNGMKNLLREKRKTKNVLIKIKPHPARIYKTAGDIYSVLRNVTKHGI